MRAFLSRLSLAAASALLFLPFGASAQNAAAQQEIEAAMKAAYAAAQEGPADVKLGDQAVVHLPESMFFVPRIQADRLMAADGNGKDPSLLGVVMPKSDDDDWVITVNFDKAGYIKDDDAKNWNVSELLDSLRDGTEESNVERKKRGFPELVMDGWVEAPKYDSSTQRLVWSVAVKHKGETANDNPTVNYNTYALGRDGYITLDLITQKNLVPKDKTAVLTLLDNLKYVEGKRYADFNSSTDKVAEYGLAALVAGVAAKKLGLFAVIAAFLAKFAKVGILAAAALGGGLWKRFRGKKAEQQQP
ncbi:DUF2167 domain-containing protein [Achromobacter xylosoxidans]|uniref:DUF2167 domain-containing protein n=1 Tax=Alcaligenes xylosoxydans xylosoxydans TaxID=85698 RepID=UPI0003D60C86|nr:DUF2167 domain-containing protein [Achromobacter xylosoxidans]AHC45991.1 putative membrane protein [Achromobacter xylosoxidans NBRC 15126 = ATCC 27061]QKQ56241.1 DUF2167 domain-containing protein [Achromobacter xylosoxidans]QPR94604.1 DUF2167 domain-containing protein [Achromobacter xylosoxidans]UON38545.1 DUF2167 domain-containing protein [Achromobacter xylosoxidans]CKH06045.1 Uncharacterized membrane-anchored protein conserved in bacteria [Achromobacter xylosoxidans]